MGMESKLKVEHYTALWRNYGQLKLVARDAGTTTVKVRKLLITAGIYSNAQYLRIAKLVRHGMRTRELVKVTGLGPRVVDSYRPYRQGPYARVGWGLKMPSRLAPRPIISSLDGRDMQPWLGDMCERLIQSLLSFNLYADVTYPYRIPTLLPLASQYVPALRSLAGLVFGMETEEPLSLDYGNLTVVDVMVSYQFGRWLRDPWHEEGAITKETCGETPYALEREGEDIHPTLRRDVKALASAYAMLVDLFACFHDAVGKALLEAVKVPLAALYDYLRLPRCRKHPFSQDCR